MKGHQLHFCPDIPPICHTTTLLPRQTLPASSNLIIHANTPADTVQEDPMDTNQPQHHVVQHPTSVTAVSFEPEPAPTAGCCCLPAGASCDVVGVRKLSARDGVDLWSSLDFTFLACLSSKKGGVCIRDQDTGLARCSGATFEEYKCISLAKSEKKQYIILILS